MPKRYCSEEDLKSQDARLHAGDRSCIVEIERIYGPGFIMPGYVKEGTEDEVTLKDIGTHRIMVPIAMLREHDLSNEIRTIPPNDSSLNSKDVPSKTAAAPIP